MVERLRCKFTSEVGRYFCPSMFKNAKSPQSSFRRISVCEKISTFVIENTGFRRLPPPLVRLSRIQKFAGKRFPAFDIFTNVSVVQWIEFWIPVPIRKYNTEISKIQIGKRVCQTQNIVSSCSSMDRILDSGSNDKGSIPFGSTKLSQLSKVGSFCFRTFGLLWRNLQWNVVQMWLKMQHSQKSCEPQIKPQHHITCKKST